MIDVVHLKMESSLLLEKCSKNDARNLFSFMEKNEVYLMILKIGLKSFDNLKDELSVAEYIRYFVDNSIGYFLPKKVWLEEKAKSNEEYKFIGKYFIKMFLKREFPGIGSFDLISYYKSKTWPISKIAIPFLEYYLCHGGDLKLSVATSIGVQSVDKDFYYLEEAVEKFKNALQVDYFCNVSSMVGFGLEQDAIIITMEQIESSLARLNGEIKSTVDYLLIGIENIRKKTKVDRWLGRAPFCNPDEADCEKEYGWGYEAVDNKDVKDEDFVDYGSACQSGYKILCRYNGKPTKYYPHS